MRSILGLGVIALLAVGLHQGVVVAAQPSSPECDSANGSAADVKAAVQFVRCAFRHQKELSIRTDEAELQRKKELQRKIKLSRDPADILDQFGVYLTIVISGDEYGWNGHGQKQMLSDVSGALKRFLNLAPLTEYDGVMVLFTYTKRDDYGNLATGNAARISVNRASLGRINWDHFKPENLPRIARDFESRVQIDGPLQERARQ